MQPLALLRNCIYSGICEHRVVIAHLNQAHRFQFFQMGRVDRKQFPAFCPDVPEGPTEVDSFLNVKVVERVVVVGHFAQGLTKCSTNCKPAGTVLFPARCERLATAIILTENANRENAMSDQHQVNSIIAAAISDARKDHPDGRIDPEEAKQVAKCIIEALSSAGLQIVPVSAD